MLSRGPVRLEGHQGLKNKLRKEVYKMPRRRIKSKKKIDIYRHMRLWDSLHIALALMDLEKINIDWNNRELIKKLWKWHGNKIMDCWFSDISNFGKRPKIWWHIYTKKSDWKVLGSEDLL